MTQLLQKAIERVRELSATEQDLAAAQLMTFIDHVDVPDVQLSDEQVTEIKHRMKKKKAKTLTLAQLDARLRRRDI